MVCMNNDSSPKIDENKMKENFEDSLNNSSVSTNDNESKSSSKSIIKDQLIETENVKDDDNHDDGVENNEKNNLEDLTNTNIIEKTTEVNEKQMENITKNDKTISINKSFIDTCLSNSKKSRYVIIDTTIDNKYALALAFILIAVFYFSLNTNSTNADLKIKPSIIKVLRQNFPNQTKDFFSNVISCYEHSIEKDSDPSIIMFVSDKSTNKNVNCVINKLLKVLVEFNNSNNNNYKNFVINSNKYENKDVSIVKKQLDDDLIRIFKTSKIGLVENINKIPAESMLLFYTYGDDASTSKYKGIMILLTYELDEILSKEKYNKLLLGEYSKLSSYVEKNLNDKWSNYVDYDQLKPLYTRIANNIVLVNHEQFCE